MNLKGTLASRKFWLAFATLVVATLLLGIPPWFGQVLLSGTQFVSLVSIVFGAYFVANTLQHRLVASDDLNKET